MDVRVVLELSSPGVEDAGEAGCASFGFGLNDVFECDGTLFDEDVVEFFGVFFTDAA